MRTFTIGCIVMLVCLCIYSSYMKTAKRSLIGSFTSLASGVSNRIKQVSKEPSNEGKGPDYGRSSIITTTSSPITMRLLQNNSEVTSDNEGTLKYILAPPGKYNLVVSGASGTAYKIDVIECEYCGKQKISAFNGVIPGEGRVKLEFEHVSAVASVKKQ